MRSDPGGEDLWRRAWQPTPVFLPGESHGQRSLAGYSPGGYKESDMTEHTHDGDKGLWESHSLVFLRKPPEKTFSLSEGCGRGSM